MLLLKSTLTALLFPLLLLPVPGQQRKIETPVEIRGVVTNAETGKPIQGMYLFVTEGEEEALTNAKGEFRIKTWKALPLVLTSQNQEYHTVKLKVSQPETVVNVKLKKK
ncbi:MAG: carboxypeptidase-like regulatory domain-containing protein [Chitinophagaceae bacterium]